MRYNQYAYQQESFDNKVNELQSINFLPQNYQMLSFSDLLTFFIKNTLVEAKTDEAKADKLKEFAVSDKQNLAEFLATNPTQISADEFYNTALQLLGYHVNYDYSLREPLSMMKRNNLPHADHDINSMMALIDAVYLLLNTRAKNGQTLLDNLAGLGYFTQFWGDNKFKFFNGKSLPVFNTDEVIREVVYVESDLDTDQDGKSDLMQVTIFRPKESDYGLKVPALYTADPYFGGVIANESTNHSVDVNLTDATKWTDPKYVPASKIPAQKPTDQNEKSTENAVHKAAYTLNEYLLARGFANVYAGAIGTRDSDGLRITGAPEETIAAKEVIEWLTGDRIAYTDRTRTKQTKAYWCNQNIGMTGRSYLGTLQIAIATTGIKGLKTVVSEAAISSWYDYYREHGLVIAPEACQGEDLDKLAETCQSNLWDAGDYLKIKPVFDKMQKTLLDKSDRITGQYSDFWDARNYRHHTDNIKCSFISVHGLNDWNVKPKNVYKLWQKISNLPIKSHLFLHQGPHYNMNNLVSIDFTDLMNLWFCHELLNLKNNAYNQWPTVIVQDNLRADIWHEELDWNNDLGKKTTYYPTKKHALTLERPDERVVSFEDIGGSKFKKEKISEADWQYKFIIGKKKWAKNSLRFETEAFAHPITIIGRPEVKVRVSGSLAKGQLSVALVEIGDRQRLTPTPKFLMKDGQELGYRFGTDTLQEFVPDKMTEGKLITKAHMNLQNYADMKRPEKIKEDQFVDLKFKLQPTYYQVPAGSKLVMIIYSTDMGMTKRPLESETYTIDLGKTSINFSKR